MLRCGSRNLLHGSYLGRRMKTGLQDKAPSPGSSASTDSEFAASLAGQLAAQAERFHKPSPANADDDFAKSLAAKLAARSERLRAAASSTPSLSNRSDLSAPGIDPRETTDRFFSLLASIRVGHIWVGFLLLMLFAGAAVLAVWGLPFPPSEPLPSSHIEAKAAVPHADAMPGKAPPPTSAPVVSPPAPSPATSSQPPPAPSAPQVPPGAQAKSAPLKADEIRELQGRLKALSLDPGPVDGVVGPMTLSAVRKYSEARAIANAEATRDLLVRLRSEPPPKK
jgi:hypothetical protein